MSTIPLQERTTATPEQFIAALIDFGPGRSQVFVHHDWSDPDRVVARWGRSGNHRSIRFLRLAPTEERPSRGFPGPFAPPRLAR
jgi:hypothetical protein